eukprot:6394968-Prymnesium_polylepis.1
MGDRARGSRSSDAASRPLPLAVLIGIGLNSSPTSLERSSTRSAVLRHDSSQLPPSGSYPHHP